MTDLPDEERVVHHVIDKQLDARRRHHDVMTRQELQHLQRHLVILPAPTHAHTHRQFNTRIYEESLSKLIHEPRLHMHVAQTCVHVRKRLRRAVECARHCTYRLPLLQKDTSCSTTLQYALKTQARDMVVQS